MADASLSDATVAILQALNQYTLGLAGGYFVDLLMDHVPIADDNLPGRIARQFVQAGLNGLLLSVLLKFIHGAQPGRGYRDFTGGYMLTVGLVQSQPSFMKNGKELFTGLTMIIKDGLLKEGNKQAAAAADASPASKTQ